MQRKARLNAIKTILKAATEGEKIKSVANRELEKAGISLPNYPEPKGYMDFVIWDESPIEYDDDELTEYEEQLERYQEFLDGIEGWDEMKTHTSQVFDRLMREKLTIEQVGEIVNSDPEKPIDMDDISLWECEYTEYDLVYQDHLDDEDILAYFGDKYDFSFEGPWPSDVAEIVIKRGLSLDELPDKLLFNKLFVNDYIGQVALIRAKEMQAKGFSPKDVELASDDVKLNDVKNSTKEMEETAKENPEHSEDDKNLDE